MVSYQKAKEGQRMLLASQNNDLLSASCHTQKNHRYPKITHPMYSHFALNRLESTTITWQQRLAVRLTFWKTPFWRQAIEHASKLTSQHDAPLDYWAPLINAITENGSKDINTPFRPRPYAPWRTPLEEAVVELVDARVIAQMLTLGAQVTPLCMCALVAHINDYFRFSLDVNKEKIHTIVQLFSKHGADWTVKLLPEPHLKDKAHLLPSVQDALIQGLGEPTARRLGVVGVIKASAALPGLETQGEPLVIETPDPKTIEGGLVGEETIYAKLIARKPKP